MEARRGSEGVEAAGSMLQGAMPAARPPAACLPMYQGTIMAKSRTCQHEGVEQAWDNEVVHPGQHFLGDVLGAVHAQQRQPGVAARVAGGAARGEAVDRR